MITVRIPDPNEPQRLPDGVVENFYFWLGSDEEIEQALSESDGQLDFQFDKVDEIFEESDED